MKLHKQRRAYISGGNAKWHSLLSQISSCLINQFNPHHALLNHVIDRLVAITCAYVTGKCKCKDRSCREIRQTRSYYCANWISETLSSISSFHLISCVLGGIGEIILHFYKHSGLCVVVGYVIYNVGGFCTRMNYGASK
jgi:hypothetical protein